MSAVATTRVCKSESAEIRVARSNWKGRCVVDIRLWFIPPGGGDYVPSRKGITVDAGKLEDLIRALQEIA